MTEEYLRFCVLPMWRHCGNQHCLDRSRACSDRADADWPSANCSHSDVDDMSVDLNYLSHANPLDCTVVRYPNLVANRVMFLKRNFHAFCLV